MSHVSRVVLNVGFTVRDEMLAFELKQLYADFLFCGFVFLEV